MTYSIIDHGLWQIYTPDNFPEDAPSGAMFTRRVADGADWYDFARNPESWTVGSVRAITLPTTVGDVVLTANRDEHMLFPGNGRVIEIVGVDPEAGDLHELLANKICNLTTGEFTDPPKPPVTRVTAAQAVTTLFNRGILPQVEDICNNHPYQPVRIFYQRANTWEIGSPYVQAIAVELGMDDDQLQGLFGEADKIV